MGNDGGSIPDRRDLVRNKPKAEQADKANQTRAKWFFCALSKRKLQEPVVSCELGKLYNKDAIIEFLLDKTAFGDGEDICGHIRSLKDLKTLKLTPNPAPASADSDSDRPQFVCPLTLKEMNGLQPFVYLRTCGTVFTQAGLKTVSGASPTDGDSTQFDICPQCATKYDRSQDIVLLNPSIDDEEVMREKMRLRRLAEPARKSKKRKAEKDDSELASKKAVPSMHPSMAAASRGVTSSLAMAEAQRKAGMSDAVKSMYTGDRPQRKETFMTMGTFTRYA